MSETFRPAIQPPAQLVSSINQPAPETDHSFLFSFAGRKACCHTSTHDCITYTGMTSRFAGNSHVAYWQATKLAGRQHFSVCCVKYVPVSVLSRLIYRIRISIVENE